MLALYGHEVSPRRDCAFTPVHAWVYSIGSWAATDGGEMVDKVERYCMNSAALKLRPQPQHERG
jgi:hypothetical protein